MCHAINVSQSDFTGNLYLHVAIRGKMRQKKIALQLECPLQSQTSSIKSEQIPLDIILVWLSPFKPSRNKEFQDDITEKV